MKAKPTIVYRCTCGASVIVNASIVDVWCLPCGRRMKPAKPAAGSDNPPSHGRHTRSGR